jgi:cAMP phosphodiesterase
VAKLMLSLSRCFLISHSHLDHVNGLVLSAGAHCGPRKRVFGASATLKDMELIFSDRIWPNLASWKESDPSFMLLYSA